MVVVLPEMVVVCHGGEGRVVFMETVGVWWFRLWGVGVGVGMGVGGRGRGEGSIKGRKNSTKKLVQHKCDCLRNGMIWTIPFDHCCWYFLCLLVFSFLCVKLLILFFFPQLASLPPPPSLSTPPSTPSTSWFVVTAVVDVVVFVVLQFSFSADQHKNL